MHTKKEKMTARFEYYGAQLNAIFHTQYDNVTLYKKLKVLEAKQSKANADYRNGVTGTKQLGAISDETEAEAINILGDKYLIYISYDPRGHALKICGSIVKRYGMKIVTDCAGNGLLAPDLSDIGFLRRIGMESVECPI